MNTEIIINWWVILAVTIGAFVFGALWYSVFFGKSWMQIMGSDKHNAEEKKKLEKEMGKFYALEFLITGLTIWTLYMNVKWLNLGSSGIYFALFMWLGYMLPVTISGVIWGNTEKKYWSKQIAISLAHRFIVMMAAAYIFSIF